MDVLNSPYADNLRKRIRIEIAFSKLPDPAKEEIKAAALADPDIIAATWTHKILAHRHCKDIWRDDMVLKFIGRYLDMPLFL